MAKNGVFGRCQAHPTQCVLSAMLAALRRRFCSPFVARRQGKMLVPLTLRRPCVRKRESESSSVRRVWVRGGAQRRPLGRRRRCGCPRRPRRWRQWRTASARGRWVNVASWSPSARGLVARSGGRCPGGGGDRRCHRRAQAGAGGGRQAGGADEHREALGKRVLG